MEVKRIALKRTAVWLVLGLVGGGPAADLWWQQEKRSLMAQLQQEQLATAGAERDLRHRYEDLVARGRK